MPSVQGIDAIMIYADDAAALSRWYAENLGLETTRLEEDGNYYGDLEDASSGKTIHVGIYPAESSNGQARRALMVNYRVDDFEGFLAHLRTRGVEIEKTLEQEYGRFAYIHDPEGNPIEIFAELAE